ncbi:hypothetical protein FB446DRAFT_831259 [Lentinula raphanica]|nr:hypothetical protein FB446DRAFT_831259 [Lentinula raphanica]
MINEEDSPNSSNKSAAALSSSPTPTNVNDKDASNPSKSVATISSPPKPTVVDEEGTSHFSLINPRCPQSQAHRTVQDFVADSSIHVKRTDAQRSLIGLLDQFGEFVMINIPLSQALFKVGASIYLLFLARVLQKFWAMFHSQALAVGLGNLGLSVALSILIRLGALGPVRLQVDEVGVSPLAMPVLKLTFIRGTESQDSSSTLSFSWALPPVFPSPGK